MSSVERGRDAFVRRAWGEARALLDGGTSVGVEDLERLAVAAYLAGRDDDSAGRGFLLVPRFLEASGSGDHAAAGALAEQAVEIGQRFDDPDLMAFGLLCSGEAMLALGRTDGGMTLLDEAMAWVTSAEVSPITAGIVYCAVIEACIDGCDLRRAREWTEALHRWCAAQPDLVPYRGQCLVHRSQVLQANGAWADAFAEAERARQLLSDPAHPALGLVRYQQGELHRLRGELAEAERAYREAGQHGLEPVPGMALLWLAQGNVAGAVAAARRMVEESHGRLTRPVILAAAVEVLLAAGETRSARSAADELARLTDVRDVPLLRAISRYATGSVLLADEDLPGAIAAFRRACAGWRRLGMPYDAARARMQLARARLAQGDHEAADAELDAARAVFERLGARPDLARVAALAGCDPRRPGGLLTARQCEVLRLVATGRTNREIAAELVISEHTVARHLQNIFLKLDLTSRTAATAYAYEHDLV